MSKRKNFKVFDNGGKSFDRYTVALPGREHGASPGYDMCLSLSSNPESPTGVSQFSDCKIGKHLGKKIPYAKLPKNIRNHVQKRLSE